MHTKSRTSATFVLPGFGISGKAGVGKTTFAKLLMERLSARGADPVRVAFAMPLKMEVLHNYGLRKGQPGWREAAVKHGALRRETDGPDYWVRKTAQLLDIARARGRTPVVDDLRLLAELEFLGEERMLCMRLEAPAEQRAARLRAAGLEPEAAYSTDPTECELDDAEFDMSFVNDDDVSFFELRSPAERLCRHALANPLPLPTVASCRRLPARPMPVAA